jgi:hypothetical protein
MSVRKLLSDLFSDALVVGGVAAVSYGAWLISGPDGWAGWVVGGCLVICIGIARSFMSARSDSYAEYLDRKNKRE